MVFEIYYTKSTPLCQQIIPHILSIIAIHCKDSPRIFGAMRLLNIVENSRKVLIFVECEGIILTSVKLGVKEFAKWLKKRQRQNVSFTSEY